VILVIDSCDAGRISLAKEELHKMCADEVSSVVQLTCNDTDVNRHFFKSLKGALLLVFANKQDVRGCLTAARISEELKLTDLRDRECNSLFTQSKFLRFLHRPMAYCSSPPPLLPGRMLTILFYRWHVLRLLVKGELHQLRKRIQLTNKPAYSKA
jgi:hypothetical protein